MRGSRSRPEIFSLPNLLSLFRIILIPIFIVVFFTSGRGMIAAAILVASGLTDMLDGAIARRFGMVTRLGKLLDPVADKLTQATVCVCLVIRYRSLFFLLLLFIVKEALMIAGGAKMLRQGVDFGSSRWYGKLATFVFYLAMIAIIAFNLSGDQALPLILVALCFMIFAFVRYLLVFRTLTGSKFNNRS